MSNNYVKFNVYGDTWRSIQETGKYVFQNCGMKIDPNNSLAFLVFHYIAHYNLSELEYFFRLAGFPACLPGELPDSSIRPVDINLANRNNVHSGWFGGLNDEESAKRYIESKLGTGVISRYQESRGKKPLCKNITY